MKLLSDDIISRLPDVTCLLRVSGHRVVLRMVDAMPTGARGHMLLEFEKRLHREVDPSIEVFLEPMGDINKLRAETRGVMR